MSLSRFFPTLLIPAVATVFAETVVDLDRLEVTAPRLAAPSLTTPDLAAARAELARTPGGVETVDAERYLRGRASTLADTFALSPGVVAQPRFGSDEARLSIRGSGLQRTFHGRGIRVLQDGVPINLADGGFDMQALEPASAAYVNIWRGGNALALGGSTLGGAIDYVSLTGRSHPGGFARLELGSWDYLRATLAAGGTRGAADAHATFTHAAQDGFRDHAAQEAQRLFANTGWQLSPNVETRLHLGAVRTRSELPGNLSKAQLEADPRQANPTNLALDQRRDFDLLRAASRTTARAGDTTVSLLAAWTYKDLDHPIFQVVDQLSNDAVAGLGFSNTTALLGSEHLLRGGVLFQRGRTDAANYLNVAGRRGAPVSNDDQTAENLEFYAESQLALGAGFTGVLGANHSRNRRATTRTLGAVTPANTYDRTFDELSPKAGLRWDAPAGDLQLFANVSGSYEPPSFSESGTAVVANRAQTATTVEAGTRGARRWLRWDFTAYHATIRDELLAVQLPPPAALGQTGTLNADRTTHRGIELGLEADLLGQPWSPAPSSANRADAAPASAQPAGPAHRLVARLAWTYGDFEFERYAANGVDYAGKQIAGLPPHLLRGELLWESAAGFYAGPTFEWVPEKSYVDHRNTFAADPYALVGFKLGWRRARGLSWFVEGKNLADERHAATHNVVERYNPAAPAQFLPGDGRAVYLGTDYAF